MPAYGSLGGCRHHTTGFRLEAGCRELEERPGAVREALALRRQAVLLVGRHLAEGARMAVGQEHRVVAEAGGSARRPYQRAFDGAFELLEMAVRPGDAERGDELRLAQRRAVGAMVLQHGFDRLHGAGEILVLAGPARGMDAGRAAERIDRQPGIVGKRRQAGRACRRLCLDAGIVAKARAGFLRLAQAELAGGDRVDAVGREQLAHLARACRDCGSR